MAASGDQMGTCEVVPGANTRPALRFISAVSAGIEAVLTAQEAPQYTYTALSSLGLEETLSIPTQSWPQAGESTLRQAFVSETSDFTAWEGTSHSWFGPWPH